VAESLDARVSVRLTAYENGREVELFAGTGKHAGLEVYNAADPGFLGSD
jgi:hypothetical protein